MPKTLRPLAFSYIRFSHPDQAKGDSLRRQIAATETWCARNGVCLDNTTTLRDLGRSAFAKPQRKNREDAAAFLDMEELVNPDRRALTAFCRLVQDGKVPRGSYFIIENLDRLSRDDTVPATHLLTGILLAGVRVVQLSPAELVLTDKADPFDVMRAVLELSRGHSESAMKSERVGKAWRQKKARAVNGEALTARGPTWLKLVSGRWHVVEEAAATVRRIFELAVAGHGLTFMVKHLNADQVPTFNYAKSRTPYWPRSSVAKILNNEAVRGIYQPFAGRAGKRRTDGEPVRDYYPRIIDETTWFAARAALASRKEKRGRIGKMNINLFSHLIFDARNGGTMTVVDKGKKGCSGRTLVSYRKSQGVGRGASFPLATFEAAILSLIREIDPREILPTKDKSGDKVLSLSGRRKEVRGQIDKIKLKLVNGGDSDALTDVVRTLEAQHKALTEELAEAQQAAATPLSESWENALTLIDALDHAEDPEDMRIRLRAALRRIVESIHVVVVARGSMRVAAVQIRFTDNKHRDYLILHRPALGGTAARQAGGHRPAQWWARSLASVTKASDLDLRRNADAANLETALTEIAPEIIEAFTNPTVDEA